MGPSELIEYALAGALLRDPDSRRRGQPPHSHTTPPTTRTVALTARHRLTAHRQEENMNGETTITVTGNLTADPELKMTPNGIAVATFTIASTPRVYDRGSNQWRDSNPVFLRCTIWRQPAEHVSELAKGTRVIATGRLKQHTFEARDGGTRTVTELEIDDIGPSLKYARTRVMRVRPDAGAATGDRWGTRTPTAPTTDREV